ncbi:MULTISPECIES: hypothetical protein [unclassified Acinetobacter]|uniref:hypothetical protein n=1 Tax=unclassified Acinetobacter TaxID=196816 RepID=UPI0015D257DB|nr:MULTISPECIES: hypothetical protein [unclassified Acinetobacter]
MSATYKFPPKGTQEAILLTKLLGGEVIRNHRAMNLVDSPCPSSVLSSLRLKRNWDSAIKRNRVPSTSPTGHTTSIMEYRIPSSVLVDLKKNDPRIEKFLEQNRKS